MKPKSAKAKGRRFQQMVRDLLVSSSAILEPDDVRSTSMGAGGEDLLLSPLARKVYPYSFECKNTEKLNIWKAIEQSRENANGYTPVVAFTKNKEEAYVAIPLKEFIRLSNRANNRGGDSLVHEAGKDSDKDSN